MTRTLYFIITTINYMERDVESEDENATAQATARDRAGRWHLRIVHYWPFSMPPSINLKALLLSFCYEAVSITNSSRLRRTWSTQNRSIVARPQTTAASRHAIRAYMK